MAKIRDKQPDADAGRVIVDEQLEKLEARLTSIYGQASKEIQSDLNSFMERYKDQDEAQKAKVENGEITQKQYEDWKNRQIFRSNAMQAKIDDLAQRMVHADEQAMAMVNAQLPETYATSYNFGGYKGETYANEAGFDYTQFTIINQDAVKTLMKEDPDLIPWKPDVDVPEDEKWNRQKVQEAVLQGIVKGDSMDDVAKRLLPIVNMDKNAAIRTARTAVNGIENKGRKDATERVKEAGVPMVERWSCTHDNRTRDTHILLDGTEPNNEGKFGEGILSTLIEYPGDPAGDPEEVYNCRCGLLSTIAGIDHTKDKDLYAQMMEKEYFEDWVKVKEDIDTKEQAFQAKKEGAADRVAERREKQTEKESVEDSEKKYSNADDLEKAIMADGGSLNDPRLVAYSETLDAENAYTNSLKNNLEQAINENGYTEGIKLALESEEKQTQKDLDNLPEMKTPEQIAQEQALQERLDMLSSLKPEDATADIGANTFNVEIPSGAREALDKFEDKYQNKTKEYSMVVDANGNIIGEAGGTKSSTALSQAENIASEGNYHIHNHPKGDIIYSDKDIENYEKYGVQGGIVITKDGTEYSLINTDPISKVDDLKALDKEWGKSLLDDSMTEKEYSEKYQEIMPFSTEVTKVFGEIEEAWKTERREELLSINEALPIPKGASREEVGAILDERDKRYEEWKASVGSDNDRKIQWLEENAEKYGFIFSMKKVK